MNTTSLIERLRQLDAQRPSVPGEHWLALGAGLLLLLSGGRGSLLGRATSVAVGGALVYRAMGGRDGLQRLLRPEADVPGRRIVKLEDTVIASAADPGPFRFPTSNAEADEPAVTSPS
jgi:hypothetical protein